MDEYWSLIPLLLLVVIAILAGIAAPNVPLPHNERLYNGCDHIWDFEYRERPHCIKCGVKANSDFEVQEWYQNKEIYKNEIGIK